MDRQSQPRQLIWLPSEGVPLRLLQLPRAVTSITAANSTAGGGSHSVARSPEEIAARRCFTQFREPQLGAKRLRMVIAISRHATTDCAAMTC